MDPKLIVYIGACNLIGSSQNICITGWTGVGKVFIISALSHSTCRNGISARLFYKIARLLSKLAIGQCNNSYNRIIAGGLLNMRLLFLHDEVKASSRPVENRDIF